MILDTTWDRTAIPERTSRPGYRALLKSALIVLLAGASARPQSPVIPDTPAGHTLQAWLDAFNSGDRGRIQAYIAKYDPTNRVDETMGFREQTGGFDLLGIDKSERLHIEFRVKEKASPTVGMGKLDVKDGDPAVVLNFGLRAIPAGMTAAEMTMKMDAATRAHVIDGAVAALNEYYVYPDVAKKMEADLRQREKNAEYDAVTDAEAFAGSAYRSTTGCKPRQASAGEFLAQSAAQGRARRAPRP